MYDIIAYVEVDDLGAIAELVRKIHEVDGIERTHTAISA
jgi:DNA-binding Lrp family transcriptional regulator